MVNIFPQIHTPIIAEFGRYPYRNGMLGRHNSSKENKFLEDTNHFAELDAETIRRIRADVDAGRWSPLQG